MRLGLAFVDFSSQSDLAVFHYHFPVIYHMHELTSTQLQYVPHPSIFSKISLLMFLPCCFIWIAGFFYLFFNKKGRPYVFLCWAYLVVIGILLWFHGKNYYTLGLYPVLFGFGSLAIENWTVRIQRIFSGMSFLLFIIVLGIYFTFIWSASDETCETGSILSENTCCRKRNFEMGRPAGSCPATGFCRYAGMGRNGQKTVCGFSFPGQLPSRQTPLYFAIIMEWPEP